MNRIITYAFNRDDGLVISRVANEIAVPVLDFEKLGQDGDFTGPMEYHHEDVCSTFGRITRYIVADSLPDGRKVGLCTDDGQLSLAVAEGLLLSGGKPDMAAQIEAHIEAFHESTQGWGPTTYGAVRRLTQGVPWQLAGARGGRISGIGNGCPMKISAASILLVQDMPEAVEFIGNLCSMTHQTSVAVSAGFAHAFGLAYCLQANPYTFNAADFVKVVVNASGMGRNYFADTLNEDDITERLALCHDYADWPPERCMAEMQNGHSYVYCSLPFSYMFFLRNPTSIESLYDVVSNSFDSDTNGSMVGALLGAVNGTSIFPDHLVQNLDAADRLIDTANRLCGLFGIGEDDAVRRVLYVVLADVAQRVGDDDFAISEFLLGGLLAQVNNRQNRYITGRVVAETNAAAFAVAIEKIEQTQAWELARAMNGDPSGEGIVVFCVWLRRGGFEMVQNREDVDEKT